MVVSNGKKTCDNGCRRKASFHECRPLYAHTPDQQGRWHLLEDHLQAVALLSRRFADHFGAGELGRVIGLIHDLGKASDQFQGYLHRCEDAKKNGTKPPAKSVDHKRAGAAYAAAFGGYEQQLAMTGKSGVMAVYQTRRRPGKQSRRSTPTVGRFLEA